MKSSPRPGAPSTSSPETRTIIDMGGEDAKLIMVDEEDGHLVIQDFAMNTMCAAGTGSFLDQQAHRLGYTIEEFSQLALKSTTPPRIAGRCSVFAKTDMIHLQQGATPDLRDHRRPLPGHGPQSQEQHRQGQDHHPAGGLPGGRGPQPGGAPGLPEGLWTGRRRPHHPAPLLQPGRGGRRAGRPGTTRPPISPWTWSPCAQHLAQETGARPSSLPPLSPPPLLGPESLRRGGAPARAWWWKATSASTWAPSAPTWWSSTPEMRVLAREYLMTAGRPLEAITEGLRRVGAKIGGRVKIMGAATTGSGRYLTGDFIGADVVRNEITAQATAAAAIDPEVDTIFEIGGQDSKFISLRNGAIVDFMMNKVCAAGTGSYLEEQAEKLGISIREEFGRLALEAENPVRMGERCTVFMESDIVHHQQRGAAKEDLVAGLSYSIVQNYLNKVAEDRPIGDTHLLPGGHRGQPGHRGGL